LVSELADELWQLTLPPYKALDWVEAFLVGFNTCSCWSVQTHASSLDRSEYANLG
jgi:hypothetical protein